MGYIPNAETARARREPSLPAAAHPVDIRSCRSLARSRTASPSARSRKRVPIGGRPRASEQPRNRRRIRSLPAPRPIPTCASGNLPMGSRVALSAVNALGFGFRFVHELLAIVACLPFAGTPIGRLAFPGRRARAGLHRGSDGLPSRLVAVFDSNTEVLTRVLSASARTASRPRCRSNMVGTTT
jgi:hypothetical protein